MYGKKMSQIIILFKTDCTLVIAKDIHRVIDTYANLSDQQQKPATFLRFILAYHCCLLPTKKLSKPNEVDLDLEEN